jgi:hypothetical protein
MKEEASSVTLPDRAKQKIFCNVWSHNYSCNLVEICITGCITGCLSTLRIN